MAGTVKPLTLPQNSQINADWRLCSLTLQPLCLLACPPPFHPPALPCYSNGFAFGEINNKANPFIGAGDFVLSQTHSGTQGANSYASFFFHWAFSAAAATIVAGAVAERISFTCYLFYSMLMTGFVYPVVVHWMWTRWGWLSPLNATPLFGSGAIDFAGGIVVHLVGGMASLIGVWFCGPRIGRFDVNGQVGSACGWSAACRWCAVGVGSEGWRGAGERGSTQPSMHVPCASLCANPDRRGPLCIRRTPERPLSLARPRACPRS